MHSPYQAFDTRAFWRNGVSCSSGLPEDLYRPKFKITKQTKIMTAGSCFAQHLARNLKQRGFSVLDVEPSPAGLSDEDAKPFGYGLYSARYGNIYTARQMLQLLREAMGRRDPGQIAWRKGDAFVDALRPNVEPAGLASADEVIGHRRYHLTRVKNAIRSADLFVFTFGLTECWLDEENGTVFPTAPGTIAQPPEGRRIIFKNFSMQETLADFLQIRKLLKNRRPGVRFLITVSPVPLTATASGSHVLAASTYSKSVLRAVAGELFDRFEDIDYYPSFELIGTPFVGQFYRSNKREVTDEGVSLAMAGFLSAHGAEDIPQISARALAPTMTDEGDDLVCEDAILEAFAR